jgi:hypothetical protein
MNEPRPQATARDEKHENKNQSNIRRTRPTHTKHTSFHLHNRNIRDRKKPEQRIQKMKNQQETKGKNLLCPKACTVSKNSPKIRPARNKQQKN